MTLDEALEARAEALRNGDIDIEACEVIMRTLPGDDPRHPFHAAYMAGERAAVRMQESVMRLLSDFR